MSARNLKAVIRQRGVRLVALAAAANVHKATVTRWMQQRIPAERVLEVERITGVPRHELRPDLYPPSDAGAAA